MKQTVLLLFLALPGLARESLRYEASVEAMGASFTVAVYGEDRIRLQGAVESAFDEVRRLDQLLSNYKPDSEWSEVNRDAAERAVPVSPELLRLLDACLEYSRLSQGAFDISVGPLMKVWGFYKGMGRLPHRAEVRGALAVVGYRNILLDRQSGSVRFARRGVEIDPGGIGKGYAVDRMVEVLRENGIRAGFITAAGSSMYALGAPPDEKGWRVKIRHPREATKTIEDVFLKDESMSTSGTAEKFFRAGRRIYSHIMDPRTGFPAQGMLSVSVIAPRTIDSEAWTKPVFINGRQWAARNLPRGLRAYLCPDAPGGMTGDQPCAWLQ